MDWRETWNNNLEMLGLAGDGRVTDDEKLALAERMAARKDQRRGPVENGGQTGRERVEFAGVVMKPRGSGAELAADVEREACDGEDARNSEQTGRRRGIG